MNLLIFTRKFKKYDLENSQISSSSMAEVRRYLDTKKAKLEKHREKDIFVTFSVKGFRDFKYNVTESQNKLDLL